MTRTKTNALLAAFVVLASVAAVSCQSQIDPPPVNAALQSRAENWLAAHGKPPLQYVVDLFADHDVVFLGEHHYIRHDPVFVQSLFKPLYDAGVRTFALEFGRREDQARIDSLVNAPEWHEDLARSIIFDQYVVWGFQEYVDLYHAAWELNHELAPGEPRFRVLGLNDSPDWSLIQRPGDADNPAIKTAVWRGGGERLWARVILDAVDRGEKVLVYSGMHHAFTRYQQPVVDNGKFIRFDATRMGNYVYKEIGDRAVTVFLHSAWRGPKGYNDGRVHPAGGVIDAVMLGLKGGPRPVGFDVAGSPFDSVTITNCVYQNGYDNFHVSMFCDGWIYTKPISEYEGVTAIPNWINASNLEQARLQMPDFKFRRASADRFNQMIARVANNTRRYGDLK